MTHSMSQHEAVQYIALCDAMGYNEREDSLTSPEEHAQSLLAEIKRLKEQAGQTTDEEMILRGWRRCAVGQSATQHCGQLEAAVAAERERESMWEEGRAWQAQASGWWSADQDPATAGLYVVRDDCGNVEVATWLCDWNGKNGEWTRELRDVDRDSIVAWMRVPDFNRCAAAIRARGEK